MPKFLHSADWQLGMTRHFLAGEAQARFTAARIDVIGTIGALAVESDCSFVVVSGDVFETNQVERHVVVRALEHMKATPSLRFYLLPGNHDPLDASSVFRSKTFFENCPPNVLVLEDSTPVIDPSGVEIVGVPWVNKRPLHDLVAGAINDLSSDGTLRIVVGHGAVDTLAPDPTNPALVSVSNLESKLSAGTIHYVALGDRHSTTDVGDSGRVWYSGAPEPTAYVENDPGNVLIVDLTNEICSVKPHRVGTWVFVREEFDLAGPVDCQRVEAFLESLPDKARHVVKLSLVGQLSLADMAQLEGTLDHAGDLLGALELWERRSDLVVLPDDSDLEGLGLSGFAAQGLDDLRKLGAGDDEDAQAARDAVGLLYRLASAGQ